MAENSLSDIVPESRFVTRGRDRIISTQWQGNSFQYPFFDYCLASKQLTTTEIITALTPEPEPAP